MWFTFGNLLCNSSILWTFSVCRAASLMMVTTVSILSSACLSVSQSACSGSVFFSASRRSRGYLHTRWTGLSRKLARSRLLHSGSCAHCYHTACYLIYIHAEKGWQAPACLSMQVQYRGCDCGLTSRNLATDLLCLTLCSFISAYGWFEQYKVYIFR